MNLFDPRAALAEIEKRGSPPATSATIATLHPATPDFVADVADVAAPLAQITKKPTPFPNDEFRHGTTFDGTPKTWTGKIVSLDAWRQLSEWEKHGPGGRMWNGVTRQWEPPET